MSWYERWLGKPACFVHATEAAWTLAEDPSVYLAQHTDSASNSVPTPSIAGLDAHVDTIAVRGLEPDERLTCSNGAGS